MTLFVDLISQVKFLSGRVDLSKSEIASLKKWISKNNTVGILALTETFENSILKHRQTSRIDFPDSSLGNLIGEIKKKELGLSYYQLVLDVKNGDETERSFAIKKMNKIVHEGKGFVEASMIVDTILNEDVELNSKGDMEDILEDTLRLLGNLVEKGKEIDIATTSVNKYLLDKRKPVSSQSAQVFLKILKKEGWTVFIQDLNDVIVDSKSEFNNLLKNVIKMLEISKKDGIQNDAILEVIWAPILTQLADKDTISEYPDFDKLLPYFYDNKKFFQEKKAQLVKWSRENLEKNLLRAVRIQKWIVSGMPDDKIDMTEYIGIAKGFFKSDIISVAIAGGGILKDLLGRQIDGSEELIREVISEEVRSNKEILRFVRELKETIFDRKVDKVLLNIRKNAGEPEKISLILRDKSEFNKLIKNIILLLEISKKDGIKNDAILEVIWDPLLTQLADSDKISEYPDFDKLLSYFYDNKKFFQEKKAQLVKWSRENVEKNLLRAVRIQKWIFSRVSNDKIDMAEAIKVAKGFFKSDIMSVAIEGGDILKDLLERQVEGSEDLIQEIISEESRNDEAILELLGELKEIIFERKIDKVLSKLRENTGAPEKIAMILEKQDIRILKDHRFIDYLVNERLVEILSKGLNSFGSELSHIMAFFVENGEISPELENYLKEWRTSINNDEIAYAFNIYLWIVSQSWWNKQNRDMLIEFARQNIQNESQKLNFLATTLLEIINPFEAMEFNMSAKDSQESYQKQNVSIENKAMKPQETGKLPVYRDLLSNDFVQSEFK
jgi:hypothetical protein